MDLDRYYELRTILQQWKARLAESIRLRIEDSARRLARLQDTYAQEGVDEPFTAWLDRWCRQAAIQFILRLLFLRVLEDRDLLGVTRIRNTDGQRMWAQLARNLGAAHYVQWCFWDAAHLLPDLFGPTDYDTVLPEDELVQRFLDDVWRRPDPDRPGWLRFDFRPAPQLKDEGFQTRFIGDLYQELDAEIRDRYALLQTPHFISRFILEHTLLKRFEEKDFRQVTLIDPTVGSGHFLVDAFWMFVARYEQAATGQPEHASRITDHVSRPPSPAPLFSAQRAEIARTIIENHLFGCDINPYAIALARFRLLLVACDYARPTSLRDFRDLHFNLVTIDSLISYERLAVTSLKAGTEAARVLGNPEAIRQALPLLRKRYDVMVGNPPYITPSDSNKRAIYSEQFKEHYTKGIHLSLLFMVRVFQLAAENCYVGLIVDNAFAIKRFGEKWVKRLLPHKDLLAVYDLSGLSIPGHGTPTLLIFLRNAPQTEPEVDFVYCKKGDRGQLDVTHSPLWRELVTSHGTAEFPGEFIERMPVSIQKFRGHPWPLDIRIDRLYETIQKNASHQLKDVVVQRLGSMIVTRCDQAFLLPDWVLRRAGIPLANVRQVLFGEILRDWTYLREEYILFPYDDDCAVIGHKHPGWQPITDFLRPLRSVLESRRAFGKTQLEAGREWFEFNMLMSRQFRRPHLVAYPAVTTSHNHFRLLPQHSVAHHSLQVFTLKPEHDEARGAVLAVLNSSVGCFCLKRQGAPKRQEDDPVKSYYDFDGTSVGRFPIPKSLLAAASGQSKLAVHQQEMETLTDQLPSLAVRKLFEEEGETYQAWNSALDGYVPPHPDLPAPFTTARELRAARDRLIALRQDIRARMIFLQEEMDWVAYEMYGLLKSRPPLAEDYLSRAEYQAARLEFGQRPFEVAGRGYQGDWPPGYRPEPLPDTLRPLTKARIAVIEANPDIALLEDPLYKRRWIPPDHRQEFRKAAEWWLAEKLEWTLEQHGRPISLHQWARKLGRDERVNAALEVLTGTPMFDLEQELLDVIRANSVPNRPEHYLRPSGLRKLHATRTTHHAGTAPPAVPTFSSRDFADATAWKLRGKLNVPRERFIYYAEFDHTPRGVDAPDTGGPWLGWAGWDAARRADALAFLIERAGRAGWELRWRQCGLRAALRDLLPKLGGLPAADRAEFETIAGLCGIGLGTACYCQAYRDGVVRGDPGVPGVGEDALGVKPLIAVEKRPGRKRKKAEAEGQQLPLELGENGVK